MNMNIDLLLIHPPYHRRSGSGKVFPLGLGYLASFAKYNGFSVRILDCSLHFDSLTSKSLHKFESWLQAEITKSKPNLLIGIGPCTTSALKSLFLIGSVCNYVYPDVPIMYGGPLASIPQFKDMFFENFNASALVSGDGEYVLLNALLALHNHQTLRTVDGITFKDTELVTNVIDDLDTLPFPQRPDLSNYSLSIRRDLFASPFATIMASRGCPFNCHFCVSSLLRNRKYTRRSYESIFSEIEWLVKDQNVKSIVFYDDTIFRNQASVVADINEFCSWFEKLSHPVLWELEMRPDVSLNLGISDFTRMYNSGCRQINFGIETSNEAGTNIFQKFVDPVAFRNQLVLIRQQVPMLRTSGTFIIGGDNETVITAKSTVDYSLSLALTFAHYYPLEIYPGTPIYDSYEKGFKGWLEEILSDDLPWGEVVCENDSLNKKAILEIISDAYKRFYSRQDWHDYASTTFECHFTTIFNHVKDWTCDRFGLMR